MTHFFCTCLIVIGLTACGFHLRGVNIIPFESIFISGNTLIISKDLKESLITTNVKLLSSAEGAELQLELIGEESEKRILSLAGAGTVSEYELFYRVHYRTKTLGQVTWSPVSTIESRRDFTYSDANLLAKSTEEKRLNEHIQKDVASSVMRRLSTLKLRPQ
ncbi:MAG TPA: hypothetical protein EYQ56_02775 [Methylophilaceae bacterium]|nr:hypothetical protein [Methylophilaceae bacterium]